MNKLFLLIPTILLFTSCGSKNSAYTHFKNENNESRAVQFTKKIDIIKDREVDTIFMATYVNKAENNIDKTQDESFLIFTYFPNLSSQNFEDNGYKFLLNKQEPISIENIDKNDEKYKNLMLKNHWGKYYLAKFKSLNSENLTLELSNQSSSKVILNFEK